MVQGVQDLVEEYAKWLRDKTVLRQVEDSDWVEITTPFLDRHNDYIQVYVRKHDEGLLLTDGGETIEDLLMSGCKLESKHRQALLHLTLNGFGVRIENDALCVRASAQNFPLRKHNLVQAILAVNDLFYLAAPMVASVFLDDVSQWMNASGIRFVQHIKFSGSSGFDHHFDFVIPASKSSPERIVRAVNRPNRDTAESMAFAWVDTRGVRSERETKAYAILNDTEQPPSAAVLDALHSYDIRPVLWSRREEARGDLAA